MFVCVYLVLWMIFNDCVADYSPILSLETCTQKSVIVRLTGTEDGGIVYVQGHGHNCKQTTFPRVTKYTFDLGRCNLEWGATFRLVVQRKARYQTGQDRQFPVTCLADLSDLEVSKAISIASAEDEVSQTFTVTPSAGMRLLLNGRDIGGATVKLGDLITMEIKLEPEFTKDFDIRARSCTASFIDIISSFCPVDAELFPEFTRVSRGVLSATFGAFRTTDLAGGSVKMTLSCVLQVCLGDCSATHCHGYYRGSGRRRKRTTTAESYHSNHSNHSNIRGIQVDARLSTINNTVITNSKHGLNENNTITADMLTKDVGTIRPHPRRGKNVSNDADSFEGKEDTDVADRDEEEDIIVEGILEIAANDDAVSVEELQKGSRVCLDAGVSITIILFMTAQSWSTLVTGGFSLFNFNMSLFYILFTSAFAVAVVVD